MRRIAAHKLYLSDNPGKCINYPVVEIEGDTVVNYYPIEEELPVTEWLGGTFILSPLSELSPVPDDTLLTFVKKLLNVGEGRFPLYCWHTLSTQIDTGFASCAAISLLHEYN